MQATPGKTRVLLFGLLGTVYIYVVLFLCVAIPVAVVVATNGHGAALMGKVLFPFFVLAYNIVKQSFVKAPPPPQGIRLDKTRFGALHAEVESLRRRARSERVHEIWLTDAFNAEISSTPRFGFFGGSVNRLILGYPLLSALSPEEARAVIGHEIGHSSRSHDRTLAWVYKQKIRWAQLCRAYEQRQSRLGNFFFRGFLSWYQPRFDRLSFGLSRVQELEADRISAELTSVEAARSALFKTLGYGTFLEPAFWTSVSTLATQRPSPPEDVLLQFASAARSVDLERFAESVNALPERPSSELDTHPPSQSRIRALGSGPIHLSPLKTSAAEDLLGGESEKLALELGRAWSARVGQSWGERYHSHQADLAAVTALESRPFESLNGDESFQLAALKERLAEDRQEPVRILRRILEGNPAHVSALYTLGRLLLLEHRSEEGRAFLERAIERDRTCGAGAHEILAHHYRAAGRADLAESHARTAETLAFEAKAAEKERASLEFHATYLPPDAGAAELEAIRALVREMPGIRAAWLVRKKVQHWPEKPFFVLAYESAPAPKGTKEDAWMEQLNGSLLKGLPPLPGKTMVVSLTYKGNQKLKPSVAYVKGAQVK